MKKNIKYQILTKDGFVDFDGVSKHTKNESIIIDTANSKIKSSLNHKLETNNGKIYAGLLQIKDKILNKNSEYEEIIKITHQKGKVDLFDIVNSHNSNHTFIANNLSVSNCAAIENWEEFYTSTYPVISSAKTSKVVMVSTMKGMNHFYKLWEDAKSKRNNFIPYEVKWQQVPDRDQEWKDETIRNTSEEAFMQEHENIALGSSKTLISIAALHELVIKDPIYEKDGLKVYEHPIEGHTYVMGVDTSKGIKRDFSAFSIIDVTEYPFKQVAVFRENQLSYLLYPTVVWRVAKQYNNAWIIVENNDIGLMVANELNYSYEYENLVNESSVKDVGLRTTIRTKNIGCQNIKSLIERKQIIINDFDTISEFSTFEEKGKSYEAVEGHTDDVVMSLVFFGWFTGEEYFHEITDKNVQIQMYKKRMENINENLLPEPYIDDGLGLSFDDRFTVEGNEVWEVVERY